MANLIESKNQISVLIKNKNHPSVENKSTLVRVIQDFYSIFGPFYYSEEEFEELAMKVTSDFMGDNNSKISSVALKENKIKK